MKPLFDFNGDGKMDMMEFLIATGAFDPNSPMNQKGSQKKDNLFEKEVRLCPRIICLFIQSNLRQMFSCYVKTLKRRLILYSKSEKVQAASMQIFVKRITVKAGQICFLNLRLH